MGPFPRTTRPLLVALAVTLPSCSSDEAGTTHDGPDPGASSGGSSGAGTGGAASGGTDPGTGGTSVGGAGGGAGSVAGESHVSFDGTRIQATLLARAIEPTGEEHVCVTVELPNDQRVWIDDIHASLSGGSHHLIVDRRTTGTVQAVPQACSPTMGGEDTRLIIAQQTETQVTLPQGVAFPLDARQHLFLQLHYANLGSTTEDISGTVSLTLVDPGAPAPVEAKSLFTGSISISLDANSPGSSEAFFTPQAGSGARHVFALTSHTHRLGVRSTIERVASASAAETPPIHESLDWSEPPLSVFTPPLAFDGSDGLRLVCRYQNDTSSSVHFGTGVDQEMCFMWVYYFDQ